MTRADYVLGSDEVTLNEIHERIQRFRRSYPDHGRISVRLHPDDMAQIYANVMNDSVPVEGATPHAFGAAFDGSGGSDWFTDESVPVGTVWIERP